MIYRKIERIHKLLREYVRYYSTRPYRVVTARKRALPDFLIIGTPKGGTGSLRYFLSQHPQIHMSVPKMSIFKLRKELDYFDTESNYKKGQLWYRSHFPLRSAITSSDLVGEKSPGYLRAPNAVKRIQKDIPNAKLICLLRNPTERAISNYFMTLRLRKKRGNLPIMEAMRSEGPGHRHFRRHGLYLEQIQRYESYLKKNQLLILSSEEFFANPQKVLKQVFKFLGVDETSQCPDLLPRNVGKNKTPASSEVYEYLNEYFKPHNQKLYKYLNRDFGW